jgi:polyhydroxybutyrate depolymerase
MWRLWSLILVGLSMLGVSAASAAEPKELQVKVGDLNRTALIYAPADAAEGKHPLIFAFHGHGGTAQRASRWNYQQLWPEAIVVYPQGIPTPGRLTDPEGKRNGWQHSVGDQDDRDLKFFDALLAKVKADYNVDDKRIYCTGHSNGGGFTYLLWGERGDVFAAVAPTAAAALRQKSDWRPKPVFHLAGENDPLVKFEWQKITIERVRKLNGCDETGKPAGEFCTEFPSKTGTPLVTYIHPGGHEFPEGAAARITQFFKEHARP